MCRIAPRHQNDPGRCNDAPACLQTLFNYTQGCTGALLERPERSAAVTMASVHRPPGFLKALLRLSEPRRSGAGGAAGSGIVAFSVGRCGSRLGPLRQARWGPQCKRRVPFSYANASCRPIKQRIQCCTILTNKLLILNMLLRTAQEQARWAAHALRRWSQPAPELRHESARGGTWIETAI